VLDDGLHSFLGVPDVLLHALSGVHDLFFAVLGVVDLSFVLCFLNFVLRFCLFKGSQKLFSDFGNLSLPIVSKLMFLLDSGEFLFEYFHGLIEGIGVFL
jgi:hypothetical protein